VELRLVGCGRCTMVVVGIATIVVLVLIVGVTVLATPVERRKHGTVWFTTCRPSLPWLTCSGVGSSTRGRASMSDSAAMRATAVFMAKEAAACSDPARKRFLLELALVHWRTAIRADARADVAMKIWRNQCEHESLAR